jgi:DNA-binding transcriptional MerR regulator
MRIGDLSRRTGVAASRIRFYEREGILPEAARGSNGYREYSDASMKTLKLIDGAQRLGFTLGEIRRHLCEAAPNFPSRRALIGALQEKLKVVDRHLDEVRERRRQIVLLLKEIGD